MTASERESDLEPRPVRLQRVISSYSPSQHFMQLIVIQSIVHRFLWVKPVQLDDPPKTDHIFPIFYVPVPCLERSTQLNILIYSANTLCAELHVKG